MKCLKCKVELLKYLHGTCGTGVASYPFESGYYCPKCGDSWSDLEISRGSLKEEEEK